MSDVKYQIFISSTFEDLKEEREQVIKACLEMGHIPVGMEMFSAADEEQWKIITRQIDDSDYFLVIIAHRYGTTINEVSFTEKEYDYAVSKNIPTLGFILGPNSSWPTQFMQIDKKSITKLNMFKKKVQTKPVSYWKNKDELNRQCVIALSKAIRDQHRPGWIRPSKNITSFVSNIDNLEINTVIHESDNDIALLKAENARLQLEIFRLKNDPIYILSPKQGESVPRIIIVEGFVNNNTYKVWPVIRPLSGETFWVQSLADVDDNGKFRAKVIIGSEGNSDYGAHYQLCICINPQIELHVGDELIDWPISEFKANIIEVIRK